MPKRPAGASALALSVAILAVAVTAQPSSEGVLGNGRSTSLVNFASPLQSFTIFDKSSDTSQRASPRSRFLPRFRAGLSAEQDARDAIAAERRAELSQMSGPDDPSQYGEKWAELEEAKDEIRRGEDEVRVEMAHDRATARFNKQPASAARSSSPSKSGGYQFVGVINAPEPVKMGEKKVKWYARRKPANSKWSVRLVHVDRDAIVRDMFVNGKVDIYSNYVNTGNTIVDKDQDGAEKDSRMPVIEGKYAVKKRSLKNLWNFSPKNFFSDSSGMLWRERRLKPGLYTDGKIVYESAYRYSDGRSGMKPVANLDSFLTSDTIKRDAKERLLRRLKEDSPDVVIEE